MKKHGLIVLIALVSVLGLSRCSSSTKSYADTVQQVVDANEGEFEKCVQMAPSQSGNPNQKPYGVINVSFSVSPEGQVVDARAMSSTTNDLNLDSCFVEAIKRTKVKKNPDGRITTANYAFDVTKYR